MNTGQADGWDVAGYSGESVGTGTDANDNKLLLNFNEGVSNDTGNTPSVSYTPTEEEASTHDLAGNELSTYSDSASDGAAPVTTISSPAAQSYHNSPIGILGSSSDSNGQGEPDTVDFVRLYYQLSGNDGWTEISDSQQNNEGNDEPFNWSYNWTPSSNGTYNIKVEATDRAGNVEQSPTVLGVVYDTVVPTDPSVSSPSHTVSVWSNDNTIDINISGASDATSGVDGFSYLWDTSATTLPDTVKDAEETLTSLVSPALADGNSHYFHLRTIDNAGNWTSTVHVGPFFVDGAKPSKPTASPSGGDYSSSQSVLFASTDDLSGLLDIYYTSDGSTPTNLSSHFSPGIGVDVTKDTTFKVIAYDKAGNTSDISEIAYGIAPTISAESSAVLSATSTTITWTTNNPASSRVVYDTVSHSSLGAAPNYGYASSTSEADTSPKVTSHSVAISGLTSGVTYYYRTISRGSPEAVGNEESFTSGGVLGLATTGVEQTVSESEVLGSETESGGTPDENLSGSSQSQDKVSNQAGTNGQVAGAETQATTGSWWSWFWWIIPLFLLGFLIYIGSRRSNR